MFIGDGLVDCGIRGVLITWDWFAAGVGLVGLVVFGIIGFGMF